MPYAFSIADLYKYEACCLDERVADLEDHLGREVPKNEDIPMSVWAEFTESELDLIWALRCRPEGADIAAQVARRVANRIPWGTINAEAAHLHADRSKAAADAADAVDASRYARAGVWAAMYAAGAAMTGADVWADVRADILELTAT